MTWPIRGTGEPEDRSAAMARAVQDVLIEYRAELYAGRGPGITQQEWRANTSLRPTVGGLPTAASREELHLRTLRARGQVDEAAAQAGWAGAQFAVRAELFGVQPAEPQSARSNSTGGLGLIRWLRLR